MGILLVYDITDEQSFTNIRNWMRQIEQHASDSVNKILIGNKCDMVEKRKVETAKGQQLADEFGVKFFETSAKNNIMVEQAFLMIAKDVMKRLMEQQPQPNPGGGGTVPVSKPPAGGGGKKGCC